jgi:hypothetical protein
MVWVVGKLIGIACTALGLFLLWASPVSTVSCAREESGVTCRVDRAMLGLMPLDGVRVQRIQRAHVDSTSPPADTSRTAANARPTNDTYQLVFDTRDGRNAPRGVDTSDRGQLREIADRVNEVAGGGDAFSVRSFNGFPNVAGAIFLFVGVIMVLFAR